MLNARIALLLTALLSIVTSPANAWIVTQTEPAPGSGLAEAYVVPYETGDGMDKIEIHKAFAVPDQPILLLFEREAGDQDVIEIVDEIILNMFTESRLEWSDFHLLILNNPFGEASANFIEPASATAWQQTGGETRLGGQPIVATPTNIEWLTADTGQMVPWGDFSDAPENQLILRGLKIDVSTLEVGDSFILKEWPTHIPEPATLSLLGIGAIALMRRKK